MTNNDIEYARTASSDVFGKLDDEIPAIRIDNETILRLHKEAHECGMNVTEFCRTVLRGRVWGSEHIETVNAERIRRAIGNAGTLRGNGVAT
jgi:hypothetical protein